MPTTVSANPNQLLLPEQAAEMLGVAEQTLAVWRTSKRYQLRYVRVGRLIRYKLADVEAFIEARTERPGEQS